MMSKMEWKDIYRKAWDAYFSPEHVESVIRRAVSWGFRPRKLMAMMFSFHASVHVENVHPLEGGIFRRKHRRDRRRGTPIENPLIFYVRYSWETLNKLARFVRLLLKYRRSLSRALKQPSNVIDIATQPVKENDLENLELFNATAAARATASHKKTQLEHMH